MPRLEVVIALLILVSVCIFPVMAGNPKQDGYQFTWNTTDKNHPKVVFGKPEKIDFNLTFSRWDGDAGFTFVPIIPDVTFSTVEKNDSHVTLTCPGCKLYLTVYEKGDQGFEYELILTNKPKSNTLSFNIIKKNVGFYYQPPATQMYAVGEMYGDKRIDFVNETMVINGTEVLVSHNPNYIGSYAVYRADDLAGDFSRRGGYNYAGGKLGDIMPPILIDALGNRIKANMNITGTTMTITVPQQWLNQAQYPVVVDPEFGYHTVPTAGVISLASGRTYAGKQGTSPSTSGNAIAIVLYCNSSTGAQDLKVALYSNTSFLSNSSYPASPIVTNTTANVICPSGTSPAWTGVNITATAVTGGTKYHLAIATNTSYMRFPFNYVSAGNRQESSLGVFLDPFGNAVYSSTATAGLYAIYDEPSGEGGPPEAAFSCSPTSGGVIPTTAGGYNDTTCTDASTTTPTSWNWTLENVNGTVQKYYTTPIAVMNLSFAGQYTVRLNVTNASGQDWENKTTYLTVVNRNATAIPLFTPAYGNSTTHFTLNDTGSCVNCTETAPSSWYWLFDDATTATTRNISEKHLPVYDSFVYFNNLSLRKNDSTLTPWVNSTWPRNITNTPAAPVGPAVYKNTSPTVAFQASDTTGIHDKQITFTGGCADDITCQYYTWDFGDGNTSALQNDIHTYEMAGLFTVSYWGGNYTLGNGTDTYYDWITIYNPAPTVNDPSWDPGFGNTTTNFNFFDASTGDNLTGWKWLFPDSATTSTDEDPANVNFACVALDDRCQLGVNHTAIDSLNTPWEVYGTWKNLSAPSVTVYENTTTTPNFDMNPPTGDAPLPVAFVTHERDEPGIQNDNYKWDFNGDGTIDSTAPNDNYNYATPGVYTIKFMAGNYTLGFNWINTTTITVSYGPVIMGWNYTPTTGTQDLDVVFVDNSTNATSFYWDFGDGNTSSTRNLTHKYELAGWFNIRHGASNGTWVWSNSSYILVNNTQPVPSGTRSPTFGNTSTSISFTDTSTGDNLSAWGWDYGDSSSTLTKNPSHTYSCAAVTDLCKYTVVHNATDSHTTLWNRTEQTTYTDWVTIYENSTPVANFTGAPLTGNVPFNVVFDATTIGPIIVNEWYWMFGDGDTDTVEDPTHQYAVAGTYSVNLSVTNYTLGRFWTNRSGYVTANPAGCANPVNSTFNPSGTTTGTDPKSQAFTDTSTGTPTSWNWSFKNTSTIPGGNGTEVFWSAIQNPTHSFGVGNFSIYLNTTNSCSQNLSWQVSWMNISLPSAPVASFTPLGEVTGTTPKSQAFTDTSTNSPTAWVWNATNVTGNNTPFTFSNAQNPTQSFGIGNFSIKLKASNAGGSGISAQVTFINVSAVPPVPVPPDVIPACDVIITANITSGYVALPVAFNDSTVWDGSWGTPVWNWSFGDGKTATVQNLTAIFNSTGFFKTQLLISNESGWYCSDSIWITVKGVNVTIPSRVSYEEETAIPFWTWAFMLIGGGLFLIGAINIPASNTKLFTAMLAFGLLLPAAIASPVVGFFSQETIPVKNITINTTHIDYYIQPIVHQATQPWVAWLLYGLALVAFLQIWHAVLLMQKDVVKEREDKDLW